MSKKLYELVKSGQIKSFDITQEKGYAKTQDKLTIIFPNGDKLNITISTVGDSVYELVSW